MTTLAFDLPQGCQLATVIVGGNEVSTWEVAGLPMIIRQTVDVRDSPSSLAFDFVHGGYLRQLVAEAPNGVLELSGFANVDGSAESTLSRVQSGSGPSITYVLSVVAPESESVCTLQVSYPLSFDDQCRSIALDFLRSAHVDPER
jgi:hypothetical protein